MRRHAAVLGSCLAAWSGVARADAPVSTPAPRSAPAAIAAPAPASSSGSAPAPAPASAPAPAPASAPAPAPAPASAPASASASGSSAGTPGADQIQFAARQHDLGYRAYLDKQYDEAASHFENAFFAAPNPAELRSAMRARRDAGELARAATLAAIGLRRFPDDAVTGKAAADVIAQARPHVYEVQITSPDEYSVAIDEKIVAAERVKESRLFVDSGRHELLVSWADDRNTRIPIEAKEGGSQSLQLEPPAPPVPTPAPAPLVLAPAPVLAPVPAAAAPPPSKPFGPAVFITGAAVTAVGAGLIVWSGIETENKPGAEAVRNACPLPAGLSNPYCNSLYQEGRGWQTRTNVLIAVTSGLAVATGVVGLFFTNWSSSASPSASSAGATGARAVRAGSASSPHVSAVFGIGQAGLEGTF